VGGWWGGGVGGHGTGASRRLRLVRCSTARLAPFHLPAFSTLLILSEPAPDPDPGKDRIMPDPTGCRKMVSPRAPKRSDAGCIAAAGAARRERESRPACVRSEAKGDRTDVTGFTPVTARDNPVTLSK
jgi:hypothetical protein